MQPGTFKIISYNLSICLILVILSTALPCVYFFGEWEQNYIVTAAQLILCLSSVAFLSALAFFNSSPSTLYEIYSKNRSYKQIHKIQFTPVQEQGSMNNRFDRDQQVRRNTITKGVSEKLSEKEQSLYSLIRKSEVDERRSQLEPQRVSDLSKDSDRLSGLRDQTIFGQGTRVKFERNPKQEQPKPKSILNPSNFSKELQNESQIELNEKYGNTLRKLDIDINSMKNLLRETKSVCGEKINQNIFQQEANLKAITECVRTNFIVNFEYFSQKQQYYSKNWDWNMDMKKIHYNSKTLCSINLPLISFDEMLLELMHILKGKNHLKFQFAGFEQNRTRTFLELKKLLEERITLDSYLLINKESSLKNFTGGYLNERYARIATLKKLCMILKKGDRESQQRELNSYFKPTQVQTKRSQIQLCDLVENYEVFIKMMIRLFNQKLRRINCYDCLVTLTPPNFEDPQKSHIWVKKLNTLPSNFHYNIVYNLKKLTEEDQKTLQKRAKAELNLSKRRESLAQSEELCCKPGSDNIWTCIAFIRVIILESDITNQAEPLETSLIADVKHLRELLRF